MLISQSSHWKLASLFVKPFLLLCCVTVYRITKVSLLSLSLFSSHAGDSCCRRLEPKSPLHLSHRKVFRVSTVFVSHVLAIAPLDYFIRFEVFILSFVNIHHCCSCDTREKCPLTRDATVWMCGASELTNSTHSQKHTFANWRQALHRCNIVERCKHCKLILKVVYINSGRGGEKENQNCRCSSLCSAVFAAA